MARKKLERKVKQIIIHVENIKEIIPLDSDEKPNISKEQQKAKIEKMKNVIKKIHNKFHDTSQETNKTNISQSNFIIKSIPCIQIAETKTIIGNSIIHQTDQINENDIGNLKSVSNIFIEKFDKEQDDFFNDYLYDLI